jgi:hypothetical protein
LKGSKEWNKKREIFVSVLKAFTLPALVESRRPLPAEAKLAPLVKEALGCRNAGVNGSSSA